MRARFRHVAFLGAAMAILHHLAWSLDLYYRFRPTDDILQALGGLAAGVLWLRLLQAPALARRAGEPSRLFVLLGIPVWAVTAGFAWECLEFARWWWSSGSTPFYLNLPESLADIAVTGAGGTLAALGWDAGRVAEEGPEVPRPGVLRPGEG